MLIDFTYSSLSFTFSKLLTIRVLLVWSSIFDHQIILTVSAIFSNATNNNDNNHSPINAWDFLIILSQAADWILRRHSNIGYCIGSYQESGNENNTLGGRLKGFFLVTFRDQKYVNSRFCILITNIDIYVPCYGPSLVDDGFCESMENAFPATVYGPSF
jgi:hypothetical protein